MLNCTGNSTLGNGTTNGTTNSTSRGHSFNVTLGASTVVVSVTASSGNLTVQTANTTVPSRVLRTDAGECRGSTFVRTSVGGPR